MRSFLFVLAVASLCASALIATTTPSRAKSVTISCKSSGSFGIAYYSTGETLYRDGKKHGPAVVIEFKRGRGPAKAGLNPAECSYSDRAIRSSEPNKLIDNNPGVVVISLGPQPVQNSDFQGLPWLSRLFAGNGRVYEFEVHKTKDGRYFIIDHGP